MVLLSANRAETMPHVTPPAAIHLDLDGIRHIYAAHGWAHTDGHDPLFHGGLEGALQFFAEMNVRATLFVIADDLHDVSKRALLARAVDAGHEVASHSLTHRKLTLLAQDEQRREIFDSRARIADALGVEVRGFRAPGFDVDRTIVELLDAAGYLYDSSAFPTTGFARRLGIDRLHAAPHRPLRDLALLELPLPAYWPLPAPFHPSYSLVLGTWYFGLGLRRFHRLGVPLVLLFHLTDFADPIPAAQRARWRSTLFTLSYLTREQKLVRCRRMVNDVRRRYALLTTGELLHHVPRDDRGAPLCAK
jgi:peptidoglycan/xylan/chitin deacetylase (PgdA/CDA1 family)